MAVFAYLHRHYRRPHSAIHQLHGKLVKRKPYASQYHQDAAYGYLQKTTTVNTTTYSNTQRHRPQACRKIRVPRRGSQQQHELRRTVGGDLIENQPSHLPSKETQTHGFLGKQARMRLQKLEMHHHGGFY